MEPELYLPISCLLDNKTSREINNKLELVYKFAQENMISFSEVPEYLSEILKNNKYASSGMKSSISKLPDFIFKLADLKTDSYFIKTAQEKEQETSDGSDSWTRSWWASVLGFIPGVGGVISLVNIYKYSYRACKNESYLSWSCAEFFFDVLVVILDVATIAGIVAAIPTAGTSGVGSAASIAAGTVVKAMRPVIKAVMVGEYATRWVRAILRGLGRGFVRIVEMALLKGQTAAQWFAAKKATPGVLGRIFTKLENMFQRFIQIAQNIKTKLTAAIKAEGDLLNPLASPTARGRGSTALRQTYRTIVNAGQLNSRQILQWCSLFRSGTNWGSWFSISSIRGYGLLTTGAQSLFNWFMSEGATDIEKSVADMESEVVQNPDLITTGPQMKERIKLIAEESSQKLVARLRSEGKSEAEIAKIKEAYIRYMVDILGGVAVSADKASNQNSTSEMPGYGDVNFNQMWMPSTSG
jgi:hypothetical protein